MRDQNILNRVDWPSILLYLILVLIGWVNIYAAVYNEEYSSILDISQNYGKQLIFIITALVIAISILFIDTKFFSAFAFIIYGIVMLLLIIVLIAGKETAGSRSWIEIGAFTLQPSEFSKYATALVIAKFLSKKENRLKEFKAKLWTIVLLGLPMGLILLQNDTGSAIVYFAFLLVLYREGMSATVILSGIIFVILFFLPLLFPKITIIILLGIISLLLVFIFRKTKAILLIVFFWILSSGFVFTVDYVFNNVLEEHQQTRINVLLGNEKDLKGAGYNVHQSLIAIGSGGFSGKGFLKGTQTKYDFVPEQSTDFIFCTVGEEWGFIGSFIVIFVFSGLLIRLVILAERQRSHFSRIYGYSVVAILFFHFLINIGMTIGFSPVIGIPLPFLSYGGSSLWAFTLLFFTFINLDANRLQTLH